MKQGSLLERAQPGLALGNAGAATATWAGTASRAQVLEAVLVVGLVVLAAALRWPDFLYVPVFTDEAYDVSRSALVAQGRLQTLVDSSPYIGSLQNYLTAALLVFFGPQVYLPRLLMLGFGCLTVATAYLLAREWAGPLAGTLAAAFLATNPVHILVNSHIAWSNCFTPFFTTLGLLQLTRAVRRSSGSSLAWCAVWLALALLSHPAAIIIFPACAIYLAWKAPRLLRTRWLWVAGGLFLLVYSPVVVYYLFARLYPAEFAEQLRSSHPDTRAFGPGLGTDFDPLQFATTVRETHAQGRDYGPDLYVQNLPGFGLLLLRSLAGAVDARPRAFDYLADPVALLWIVLLIASLVILARRGNALPLLVVASSLLFSPLWSVKRFEPISHGRYFIPTVIAAYAAVAVVAVQGLPRIKLKYRASGVTLIGLVGFALAFLPLLDLGRFYDSRPADNRSSVEALTAIEATREPGETVVIDHRLNDRRLGDGAVTLDQAMAMLLRIRDVPFEIADLEPDDVQGMLLRRPTQLVVLDRISITRLSDRYSLTQLAVITPRTARGDRQRDLIPSWRDTGIAALLRQVDPQGSPDRRDTRACIDCGDPGVYRIAPKA